MNRRVIGQVPERATVLKFGLFFNLKDIQAMILIGWNESNFLSNA